MAHRLIRARALKAFVFVGRVVFAGERLHLDREDFDELARAGCVERAELAALVQPTDRWTTPVTR